MWPRTGAPRASHWVYLWLIQVDSEMGFRGHWGRLSCTLLVSPPPRVWIHLGGGAPRAAFAFLKKHFPDNYNVHPRLKTIQFRKKEILTQNSRQIRVLYGWEFQLNQRVGDLMPLAKCTLCWSPVLYDSGGSVVKSRTFPYQERHSPSEFLPIHLKMYKPGFPRWLSGTESACQAGDVDSVGWQSQTWLSD